MGEPPSCESLGMYYTPGWEERAFVVKREGATMTEGDIT
jgi:hypothetical protein